MRAAIQVADRDDAQAAAALLSQRGYELVGAGDTPCRDLALLVVDEWTPEDAPRVTAARAAGTPTAVLAELLLADAAGPVVGVTGTAGKTSTCRGLHHLLRACGVSACMSATARSGNAWPDHSLVGRMPPGAVVVAELTSTHLCHMGAVPIDVGVVTTVRPDHLELHGSIERYHAAKRRLVQAVPPGAPLVLPVDDPDTLAALGITGPPQWGFGAGPHAGPGAFMTGPGQLVLRALDAESGAECVVHGTEARALLAAAAAALALGVQPGPLAAALPHVPHAPHRMDRRVLAQGTILIDNTMAATPLKVRAGLDDAPPGPLVLVVGGTRTPMGTPVHDSPEERRLLHHALRAARDRATVLVAFGPAAADVRDVVAPDAIAADVEQALEVAVAACPADGTVMVAPMFPMGPDERELVAGYAGPD